MTNSQKSFNRCLWAGIVRLSTKRHMVLRRFPTRPIIATRAAEYSDDPHVPAIWRAGSQALVCANKFNLKTGPPRTGGGTEKALFTVT